MTTHKQSSRYRATRKVTLVGAGVNVGLSLAQLLGGFIFHSQGLIADGLHTLSDLASDFIVLVAAKFAHEKPDTEHPYGHGRIETLATSVLGAILLAVAAGIVVDAFGRLLSPQRLLQPEPMAIFFAALAVVSKEGLYHYTIRVARKHDSTLLKANAWHHRSDAISSLLVIIGILGSLYGFRQADALAAIGVALMIGKIGFELLWNSAQQLIDAALDDDTVSEIRASIGKIDDVVNLHQLRTRYSGSDALADVHIQVSPEISVSEGHQISESVRQAVMKSVPNMIDVTVHIDPEDDAPGPRCDGLPLRDQLLQELDKIWRDQPLAQEIQDIKLHYLSGKIDIELYLLAAPHHPGTHTQINALIAATQRHPCIRRVAVFFKHAP